MQMKKAIANQLRHSRKQFQEKKMQLDVDMPGRKSKAYDMAVQDFIPVQDIRNGIVQTLDNRYIDIIEVLPIDYYDAPELAKIEIMREFQALYEGGPCKIVIKLLSDIFNPEKLLTNIKKESGRFHEEKTNKALDAYIEHITKSCGLNTITNRYFIIYEYEGDSEGKKSRDFDTIIDQMLETENYIRGIMEQCSTICLNPETEKRTEATLEFLYYYFNRQTSRHESMQSRLMRMKNDYQSFNYEFDDNKNIRVADVIGPKGLWFCSRTYAYMDGSYYGYMGVMPDSYPELVSGGWINVFNYSPATDIDIISTRLPYEATKLSLAGLNKMTEGSWKRYVNKNKQEKADKVLNKYNNNYYVYDRMKNRGEQLMNTAIIITVRANSAKHLETLMRRIKKDLGKKHIKVEMCYDCVEDYFTLTMPFLCFSKPFRRLKHNMLSSQMRTVFCMTNYEIYDPEGYWLGINADTGAAVCPNNFNTTRYKNGNMVLIGTSGAGKTFTQQVIGTRSFFNGQRVFSIIPVKGYEYEDGCKMVDGTFIRYYPGSDDCVNIMELRPEGEFDRSIFDKEDKDVAKAKNGSLVAKKTTMLIIWLQLQTHEENIDPTVYSELQAAIPKVYEKFGITKDNNSIYDSDGKIKKMPILGDLYEELVQHKTLEKYAKILSGTWINGNFRNMNGQTNVDLSKRYIVFDCDERYIGANLLPCCLFSSFDFVNTSVAENPLSKDMVILDEVWKMLELPSCAEQVKSMIKLIRGYGGYVLLATQEINDFINHSNGYGTSVLSNTEIKIILNMNNNELPLVKEPIGLTDEECNKIKKFDRGEILFISKKDRAYVKVLSSSMEEYTFTTDINLRREIARKRKIAV